VVLISRNTLDRRTEIIERSISELMARPDDPDINPYMMPNDAIACYDSDFSNARDVAKGITDILAAVIALRLL
jgi:polysaccharide biosynthesis/export protein